MGAALRRIQLGNALSAFGNGFTVPFTFIYVSQVRGLGAGAAGAVLATFAVAALFVLPFTGRVIDRRGPVPVAVLGTVLAASGSLGLGLSGSEPVLITAAGALGAGMAVVQPALATMIVWCSSTATRSRAFATQFFLNNLGLGVGGLIGGLIVDTAHPGSFVRLFAIEASMFLVLGAVVARVRLPHAPRLERAAVRAEAGSPVGGWRLLAGDRAMVMVCVLGFVMFFACYGQFESGLSAFAVEVTRISPATLGIALAANTAVIVLAQFVVLRLVEQRRRSRVIAAVGLVWSAAWLVAGASGLLHGHHAVAVAAIISTYALFGLGEAMLSPTVAPLVADLAPERMVGQYNSAFALVKQLALALGPAVGGLIAGAGAYGLYIVMLVVSSLGISVTALFMGRRLTPAQEIPLRYSRVVAQSTPSAAALAERIPA
ncbi:Na+/melibiose symporter [Streptomyces sp. DvalAA-14]|uniref:MFS transporter n=1 Tax=unclassified Streptomyces TaxID=2593676 RepID=UPI00081B072C|nr:MULTISPECIES: MFS transporter [unclassified Streptomyces]MYS19867.1 MFS transporter [Streptomyces sp. SID4948]SCD55252.1 Na+/melibiose symporter [Streptomyces sp. DvalAA-14]